MVQQVSQFKYLGIYFDCQLQWTTHVESVCSKICQRLHFLRRQRESCRHQGLGLYEVLHFALQCWGFSAFLFKNLHTFEVSFHLQSVTLPTYPPFLVGAKGIYYVGHWCRVMFKLLPSFRFWGWLNCCVVLDSWMAKASFQPFAKFVYCLSVFFCLF